MRCHITFVTSLWILWGFTFFVTCMVGRGQLRMMLCEMFSQPLQEMQDFMSHESKPCPSTPCPIVFTLSNQHCTISQWCLHVDKRCHCWLHSNWFGFTSYSLSWNCCDSCNSSEGWSLSRLVLDDNVYPFCYRGFQMFTPK